MIFLDKEKKDELSRNARKYALENFSIDSFGENCEKLYKEAIKKGRTHENSYL